ncbi:MAG TPA: hypothetical protein QGH84_06335 [Rhodospirillales bacterium]|nr:hypothetical protein [Rhodospirillales bacterium]
MIMGTSQPANADEFSFKFEWGDIPSCTSGNPNIVPNPIFTLSNVPAGTKVIKFFLTDIQVPGYDHGGGPITYTGQAVIQPGAFEYKSPCPPSGSHTYEWVGWLKDANDDTIGKAIAQKDYP